MTKDVVQQCILSQSLERVGSLRSGIAHVMIEP